MKLEWIETTKPYGSEAHLAIGPNGERFQIVRHGPEQYNIKQGDDWFPGGATRAEAKREAQRRANALLPL